VLAGMLLGAASSMSNELVSLIFGVWLEDTFAVKITALGFTAAVIGFAELGGELSSAGLVDRIGKTRAVAAGLIVNSIVGLSLAFINVNLISALVALFLFYLSFEFTVVCSIPIITEILPQARATVMAVIVAVISLGRAMGDIISPWLYRMDQSQTAFPGLIFIGIGVVLLNLTALFALRFLSRSLLNVETPPVAEI
jgi:MFS transporter, DHA1 family, inner membrane transport protein